MHRPMLRPIASATRRARRSFLHPSLHPALRLDPSPAARSAARRLLVAIVAAALLLAFAGVAGAQQTTGNVFVTVTDSLGEALPGVRVTLSGQGAPQTRFTDVDGIARFMGLSPGAYDLTAALDSFATAEHSGLTVQVGRSTPVEVALASAGVTDVIEVVSERPLLDERTISRTTNITSVELEKIPTARDPWAVLQSVPGVLVDRVNVGGNESGQQSQFVGPGSVGGSATWSIDGVVVTDPAARGSSPTYYDFDSLDEMAVSTGGSDVTAMTGGVQVNLVTGRGTNDWRGSGRYLVLDGDWQSDSSFDSADLGRAGPWNAGNAQDDAAGTAFTERVDDYGLEVGGPVLRDRLWIWGSYGVQDVDALILGSEQPVPDATELTSSAAKLNAQVTPATSAVAFWHANNKQKDGRGAGPTRPEATTWIQDGPSDIYKLEATQIFGDDLFVTGMASYVDGVFNLTPKAGLGPDAPEIAQDAGGVWRGNFFGLATERPQEQARLDGSQFFHAGAVNHELRFGVGYRHSTVDSASVYPGQQLVGLKQAGAFGPDGDQFLGVVAHDVVISDEFEQWSALLQDTLTTGRLTVNAGLRWDRQDPQNLEAVQPASRFAPELIPAFTREARDPGFEWESLSPRIGLTWAVGEDRDTLLRASYARFTDQLGSGFFSGVGPNLARFGYFYWDDANGDDLLTPDEAGPVFFVQAPRSNGVVDNRVDPDLDAPTTDELILGLDHSLSPELVVGLAITARQERDLTAFDSLVLDQASGEIRAHRRDDYVLLGTVRGVLPDGTAFEEPVYRLRDGVIEDPAEGTLLRNLDRGRDYLGVALNFNKRLSNRWMMRGFVSWNDWDNQVGDGAIADPTRGLNTEDGSPVLVQSLGSGNKGEVWINSEWSMNLSGLYQVAPDRPWGFNVSADINGRQGFAVPYRTGISSQSGFTGDGIARTVLVAPSGDSFRNDDLWIVNARVEKELVFDRFGLTLGVDVFNLFNGSQVLQTEGQVTSSYFYADGTPYDPSVGDPDGPDFLSTNADFVRETVNPRIVRVGARLSFD